jgi:NADPH:quinone reductase-like Zn-dependent oxidoreductase
MFPGIALPYIPGTDVSGEIDAVGVGIDASRIGERVYGRALAGGYAEKTCPCQKSKNGKKPLAILLGGP